MNGTLLFLKDLVERAVKSAAGGALVEFAHENFSLVGSGHSLGQTNATTLHLWTILGFALGAGLFSVLTSLASLPVGTPNSASLVKLAPTPTESVVVPAASTDTGQLTAQQSPETSVPEILAQFYSAG